MKKALWFIAGCSFFNLCFSAYEEIAGFKLSTERPKFQYALETPLHAAIHSGDVKTVKELLAHETDVNERDSNRYTPLIRAAMSLMTAPALQPQLVKPLIEIIHILLQWPNIDVNAQNNRGFNALHCLAMAGYSDLVSELLNVPGIRLNIYNDENETPLDRARRALKQPFNKQEKVKTQEIVNLLVEKAHQQARQQSRQEARQLFYALIERAGAQSQAKTLTADDIRQIQQMLEQEEIREPAKIKKEEAPVQQRHSSSHLHLGAQSPARILPPDVIRQIQQMLRR